MLRAQLRDRTFTYPWHAVPDGQYGRPSQFGEAPRMPICCKSTIVRGFIGSKMMLRAFFSRRSTDFGAGKHNHIVSARINGLSVVRRFQHHILVAANRRTATT